MKPLTAIPKPLAFVLTFIVLTYPASAEAIYDNGAPAGTTALYSDFDPNSFDLLVETADDFLLAGLVLLQDVHWWGVYVMDDDPQNDDFTIRLFNDTGGAPAEAAFYEVTGISGNRVPTGDFFGPFTMYEYSADITPVALAGGTTYWISIINNTTYDNNDTWSWRTTGSGNAYQRFDGGAWQLNSFGADVAFQLTGAPVPEPASMLLLGLGLAGLFVRNRKS